MARYEAEEKINARKRQSELNRNAAVLTAHVQEASTDIDSPKGESAAIIAEKAGIKTRNVYLMGI